MFDYVANGQMSMFDFITTEEPQKFCNDEKINQLVDLISNKMNKVLPQFPRVKSSKVEYSIWEHVKNLGLRLWYDYTFDCEYLCEPCRWCGVGAEKIAELIPTEELKAVANSLGLELSVMQSPTALSFTTIEKRHKTKCKGTKETEEED